jgi:IrrE N-terminal-like domain
VSRATKPVGRDERAARAHALLLDRLRALTTSRQWLDMLETSRRFHSYSAHNVLLLVAQGAQGRVAGYRTWQTIPADGGGTCQVRHGATAMTVLAPVTRAVEEVDDDTGERTPRRRLVGYKPVRVFDETALVRPPTRTDVEPELLRGESPQLLYDALAGQVHTGGFHIEDGDCAPANGRTDWTTRTVTIRADLEAAQRAKTLAHELAHIRLHDPHTPGVARMSRARKEVEAESVAYLVCAHAGLDAATYTIPYVAHWSAGNLELVQETAERVLDTARPISDHLDATLIPTPTRAI